jgi:hypothetical protein
VRTWKNGRENSGNSFEYTRVRSVERDTNLISVLVLWRYGLSSADVRELGGSEQTRLRDFYESDHEWCGRGPIDPVVQRDTSARIVIALFPSTSPLAVENFSRIVTVGRFNILP